MAGVAGAAVIATVTTGRQRGIRIAAAAGVTAVIWGWGAAVLFNAGALDAVTQTLCWCVIFFFASAGASAAYLTVSEIFPVEIRARAIAVFFAIAQSFGAFGPWFYGQLIGNGQDHFRLFIGYLIGAAVMLGAGWSTPSSASTLSAGRSKRSPARWAPPRTKRSR